MILLFALYSICYAAIPAKNFTDNRFIVVGITGATFGQVADFTSCIQPEFYPKQTPAAGLTASATACLTSAVGAATVLSWGMLMTSMGTCFMKTGSSMTTFSVSAASVLAPELNPFYSNMMANFTAAKKNGKSKDGILNGGYQMINKKYNRPKINELCIAIAKKVNNPSAMKCALDGAKPIVDFTTYNCYGYTKSNLLG